MAMMNPTQKGCDLLSAAELDIVDFVPALLPTSSRVLNDFNRRRLDLVRSALLLPVLHGVDKVLGVPVWTLMCCSVMEFAHKAGG